MVIFSLLRCQERQFLRSCDLLLGVKRDQFLRQQEKGNAKKPIKPFGQFVRNHSATRFLFSTRLRLVRRKINSWQNDFFAHSLHKQLFFFHFFFLTLVIYRLSSFAFFSFRSRCPLDFFPIISGQGYWILCFGCFILFA